MRRPHTSQHCLPDICQGMITSAPTNRFIGIFRPHDNDIRLALGKQFLHEPRDCAGQFHKFVPFRRLFNSHPVRGQAFCKHGFCKRTGQCLPHVCNLKDFQRFSITSTHFFRTTIGPFTITKRIMNTPVPERTVLRITQAMTNQVGNRNTNHRRNLFHQSRKRSTRRNSFIKRRQPRIYLFCGSFSSPPRAIFQITINQNLKASANILL